MNISVLARPVTPVSVQGQALSELSLKRAEEKPADIARAFNATQRRFGEHFDCSSHAAVIKLMMMTFGQHPTGMFNEVKRSGDGYEVTMKDEFKVRLSRQEMEQAAQASRFAGEDDSAVRDANFVFAAFVKRKQMTQGYSTFGAALSKTVEGETLKRCLQGMGVYGLSQFVSSNDMKLNGAVGVMQTHDFGAALVKEGGRHQDYGYVLFDDRKPLRSDARAVSHEAENPSPGQIWEGFYQGAEGNCVTVSAIKAALMRFGQDTQGIYKHIHLTPDGFDVTMRDSFRLQLSHDEVSQATQASNFRGAHPQLLSYANFLYAVSAKRAQLENNDSRAGQGYAVALETLNDGETPGEALRRLGLFGYMRESTVEELANGAIGTLADRFHSVAVVNGAVDYYGQKHRLASSRWMNTGLRALKLA
ncbi:hypothetical protein FX985_05747 [Pseudomonas extremaustralis]|uniref:Type III secretion effector protein n=1 Tax=Pseudomonas extremaustralis TaxID=359110 RepID=A0A5M9IRI6_9PSED|nr:hypothetical protein [Pseudomonas extremaustralis]KAA8559374.1 hypothetical protein FX985_05747 [Pseudomonas extremaustralis]